MVHPLQKNWVHLVNAEQYLTATDSQTKPPSQASEQLQAAAIFTVSRHLLLFTVFASSALMPSVLWRCWLGGRKGIQPVKNWALSAGVVISLERGADLHMAQLLPLPLTVCYFSKIQIGFTFLVLAHLGSPGKRVIKRVCVCVSPFIVIIQIKVDTASGSSFVHIVLPISLQLFLELSIQPPWLPKLLYYSESSVTKVGWRLLSAVLSTCYWLNSYFSNLQYLIIHTPV